MKRTRIRQSDIDWARLMVRLAADLGEPIEPEYHALAESDPDPDPEPGHCQNCGEPDPAYCQHCGHKLENDRTTLV